MNEMPPIDRRAFAWEAASNCMSYPTADGWTIPVVGCLCPDYETEPDEIVSRAPIVFAPWHGDDAWVDPASLSSMCVAPPFNCFWVEYVKPLSIPRTRPYVRGPRFQHGHMVWCVPNCVNGWSVVCAPITPENSAYAHSEGWVTVLLDERGIPIVESIEWKSTLSGWESFEQRQEYYTNELGNLLHCMTLMSCKNAAIEKRTSASLAGSRKLYGDAGRYEYHVVVIDGACRNGGGTEKYELDLMPLHFCRGHFAEYGPKYGKGLLFGKHEGRFYVPPHIKGNAKNGVVDKDYEVAAPVRG